MARRHIGFEVCCDSDSDNGRDCGFGFGGQDELW